MSRVRGALVAVAGLVVALAPASTASPAPSQAPATIDWQACTNELYDAIGFQCATLSVPMDWSKPKGTTIELALTRLQHTSEESRYQGSVVLNPGGPGGSGTIMPVLAYYLPPDSSGGDPASEYDWIGFDPRGVGDSIPSVHCDATYGDPVRPPFDPTTQSIELAWRARSAGYAQACSQNGALLDHVTTVDSARDLDAIRAALGERTLNYYGFSYGTYLGAVYATLYPDRVGRWVLDSNVKPSEVWEKANYSQDVAFETVLKRYFGWIAQYDDVYHLGSSGAAVERLWYRTRDTLAKAPAGGQIGPAEFTDIFTSAGYVQFLWPELTTALASWVHDADPAGLVAEYSWDDNGYAMYLATSCTDARWTTNWTPVRAQNTRLARKYPFLTWANAWFNAPCMTWPAKSHDPVRVDGRGVSPILLIDETLDAATPFDGSLELRRRFPNSRLIALPGGTNHANSLAGNECLDTQIADYFSNGTLPTRRPGQGADTTCAPLPDPIPDELQARARSMAPTPQSSTGAEIPSRADVWRATQGR